MLNNKILEHILVIQQTIFPPKEISSIKEEKVNFAKIGLSNILPQIERKETG